MTRAHGSRSLLQYGLLREKLIKSLVRYFTVYHFKPVKSFCHYYRYELFKYSNNALHCRRIIRAHISWTFSHNFICLTIFSLMPFFLAFKLQLIVKNAMLSKKTFYPMLGPCTFFRVLNCRIIFQIRFSSYINWTDHWRNAMQQLKCQSGHRLS